jgi:ankyrin repeat protein
MSDNGSPSVSALLPQLTSTPSSESSHSPIPGTKRVYSSLFVPELFNIWRDCFDVPDRELTTETEHEMIASYRGKTTSFLEIHGPLGTQRLLPSSLLLIPSYVPCPSPRILEAAIQCWLALGADVNFRYDNGLTPLSWVSLSLTPGIWRHLQLLIAHGADVHAVSADGGYGLLHVTLRHISTTHLADAASTADEEARLITLLEADCDPNARDHKGRTPPETVSLNEAAMRIWNKALQRVQRRKKMTARERDADLELRGARES